ncbi:MAG: hypothetical protein V7607_4696 [Solirubrobacteraceae bacterium]
MVGEVSFDASDFAKGMGGEVMVALIEEVVVLLASQLRATVELRQLGPLVGNRGGELLALSVRIRRSGGDPLLDVADQRVQARENLCLGDVGTDLWRGADP